MSFGWSAGDIAAAITLAYKLIRALDTVDGSASDYREAVLFLRHLLRTLEPLQAFSASNASPLYGAEIEEQVKIIKEPLEKFLAKVLKYEPSLGIGAKEGWNRGVGMKMQWYLFVEKRVIKLRGTIEGHMRIIDTLMQRLTLDAVRATQQQLPDTLRTVFQQTIRPELIAVLQESLPPLESGLLDNFREVHANSLEISTARRVEHHADLSVNIREIREELKHSQTIQLRIEAGLTANAPSQRRLALPATQAKDSLYHFPTPTGANTTEPVVQLARESLVDVYYLVFLYLGHFLQSLFLVLSRLVQPAKALMPLLLAHQNISFLDAIGRPSRILPFEYFRSFQVLQAFIEHEFRDLPGSAWVFRKRYLLSDMATNRSLSAKSWSNHIAPGATVAMSMIVRRRLALLDLVGKCPEDTCSGTWPKSETQSWITCPVCQKQIQSSLSLPGSSSEQDLNDVQQPSIQESDYATSPDATLHKAVEGSDQEVDGDISPFKRITQEIIDTTNLENLGHSSANITSSQGITAIALYDYEKDESNELGFLEKDVITNIEFVDDDWWLGQNSRSETGLFPSNYVELRDEDGLYKARLGISPRIAPTSSASGAATATALHQYEAAEDNELSFEEGDIITNLKFHDEDWWYGQVGNSTGLVPSIYVVLNDIPSILADQAGFPNSQTWFSDLVDLPPNRTSDFEDYRP